MSRITMSIRRKHLLIGGTAAIFLLVVAFLPVIATAQTSTDIEKPNISSLSVTPYYSVLGQTMIVKGTVSPSLQATGIDSVGVEVDSPNATFWSATPTVYGSVLGSVKVQPNGSFAATFTAGDKRINIPWYSGTFQVHVWTIYYADPSAKNYTMVTVGRSANFTYESSNIPHSTSASSIAQGAIEVAIISGVVGAALIAIVSRKNSQRQTGALASSVFGESR